MLQESWVQQKRDFITCSYSFPREGRTKPSKKVLSFCQYIQELEFLLHSLRFCLEMWQMGGKKGGRSRCWIHPASQGFCLISALLFPAGELFLFPRKTTSPKPKQGPSTLLSSQGHHGIDLHRYDAYHLRPFKEASHIRVRGFLKPILLPPAGSVFSEYNNLLLLTTIIKYMSEIQ